MNSASPVICTSGRMSTPGASMSTTSSDSPRGPEVPASVRARHSPQRANWAYDVHTFWPETCHPPSVASARVDSPDRSDPAPGSLKSWHQISSALAIGRSQRAHCSSVPCASRVGPARLMPTRLTSWGAPLRAYSVLKIATSTGDAPRPP